LYRKNRNPEVGFGIGFIILWALGAIATAAFWCVVIWAIVKLVNHYT